MEKIRYINHQVGNKLPFINIINMKFGRNDTCPCGSGKKYKKCCLMKPYFNPNEKVTVKEIASTPELEELRKQIDVENVERRKFLEKAGIYVDFVKPLVHQGRKFWCLGSRLYYQRPPNETFHEFIIFVFCQTFGEQWRDEQLALPIEERHFLFIAYEKYFEWQKKNMTTQNKVGGVWAYLPDGYSRALVSFAFDLCSLIHKKHLPVDLLHRLKKKATYQGSRYELAVSALFARLGCDIEFLDEKYLHDKNAPPHCEFNATLPSTGEVVAVEVKSKEREGVLHTKGNLNEKELFWGNVQRLYRHALESNPNDKPFFVFIDLNAPQTPSIPSMEKPWIKDIKKMLDKTPLHNPKFPDPTNGLFITNYSYHYQEEKQAEAGESLYIIPLYPKTPIKDGLFYERLTTALSSYGNVPNLDVEIGT